MDGVVRHVLRTWLACAAFFSAFAGAAAAQGAGGQEPPGYRAAIDEALAEYQALNFEEARALFAKAHALYPNARTLRGLGMVEFERRNYRASADYLRQALDSRVRPLEGELRNATAQLLARARGFLGEVTLTVEPASAHVRLDGEPLELPPGGAIVLQVGDHVFEVQAEGYRPQRRPLAIQGGERLALRIALESHAESELAPAGDASAAEPQPAAPAAPSSDQGPWPLIVIGVGGAALIAGGVLIGLAQSDIASVEDAPKGTRWSERSDAYDGAEGKSIAGFVLLGAGAAGLVAGLVWQFAGGDDSAEIGATVQLGPGHVRLRGRF